MDRYMNDTHSLYYNVDHSSMFGSNLSTVFADGPPPLEDGDDDHGEFVFSSETDAIGEAVLNKIESKLQRDAEGRPVGDKSGLNPDVETKPNSSAEKFEAFGNFETSNQIDTSDKQDTNVGLNPEVNGYKGNLKNNSMSNDDFSDDEFGDFSTGFCQISNFNENGKSNVEKHKSNFGDFSTFNEKSVFSDNEVSFNGEGENDAKTEKDSNDFQFADFSSFGGVDYETNDDRQSNDISVIEQQVGKELNSGEMSSKNGNNDASDDEFASFTEANESDFAKFETKSNGINNPSPDVVPAKERNDLTTGRLPLDLTNHGTKHNNDEFNSFESFNNDISSNTTNDLTSAKLPPETNSTGDGFNDFTSSSDNEFPRGEHQTSQSHECQASDPGVSKPDTNSEKCKTEGDTVASPGDDDFADFADFSNNSFSAENQSDAAFGSFSRQDEGGSSHWGDSKFEAFEENSKADKSKETKVLSRNSSSCSRQDSGEFTAFSESTSPKTEPEFHADFGAFSESTLSKDKPSDFGAFSGNTSSKNKQGFQADFGAFSQNTVFQKSFDQTLPNKQHATQTRLVSLHGCFQDVFVTLQHTVEDLQHVKVPGDKRINQEDLWKNLHSSMVEGALRFSWEQCKISDKMCKALEVSKKNVMVNPNVLALSEGLEIPVFATGLGILQPSIVPTLPKKKKIKRKLSKEISNETSRSASSTPPPNLPQQTAFSEFMTESIKDNNSDTASLSNSDTASLDLDFFASAPSNLQVNSVDQSSSSSLYNLDFAFGPAPAGNQAALVKNQPDIFKTTKSVQDDPLEILKKLDTSKMSSSIVNESRTQLSSRAKEIIETFDDLSFMHSSVLMFPLHKNN